MQSSAIDFAAMTLPVLLRFENPVSDEQLMEFSAQNGSLRMERTRSGEICVMSATGGPGGEREAYVVAMLVIWNLRVRTGRVYSSITGFRLPDGSCFSPDASWVSEERVLALGQRRTGFFRVCPEFVVEIRSETDRRRTVEEKMDLWMENGAQVGWLIDPFEQTVAVYRAGEATEVLERPDVVRGHVPVEGFELDATELWSEE